MTVPNGLGRRAYALGEMLKNGQTLDRETASRFAKAVGEDGGVAIGGALTMYLRDLQVAGRENGTEVGRRVIASLTGMIEGTALAWRFSPTENAPEGLAQVFAALEELPNPMPASYVKISPEQVEEMLQKTVESSLRDQVRLLIEPIPLDMFSRAEGVNYSGAYVRASGNFEFHPKVDEAIRSLVDRGGDDSGIEAIKNLLDDQFKGQSPSVVQQQFKDIAQATRGRMLRDYANELADEAK